MSKFALVETELSCLPNVGEILQLKLYSKYVKATWLILISTVPVTNLEHQALSDEGVGCASQLSEAAVVWEV